MPHGRKVVLIGIDSGERSLVTQWSASGLLPNFRELMSHGLVGRTVSVPGLYVGATWQCFSTGASPAGTGLYSLKQLVPGSYRFIATRRGDHLKVEPFWDHLGRGGRKVAVIDLPGATLSRELNGLQIVDWGAHATNRAFTATPRSLVGRIRQRYGEHPARAEDDRDRTLAELLEYRDNMLKGIRRKTRLSLDLMAEEEWDLFLDVFTEAHSVCHHHWHMHDPAHPRHDPAVAAEHGNPVRDVFAALDRAVGELRAATDDRTVFIVFFSHGMGPDYGAAHLLDDVLLRLGVAEAPPLRGVTSAGRSVRQGLQPLMLAGWHRLPVGMRDSVRFARDLACGWIDGDVDPPSSTIDPVASRCFTLGNLAAHAGIRVNLAGREPAGKVQPGAEFEAFCRELTRDLLDIVDLDTGRPVIRRVLRSDAIYAGPHLDMLPDLLIEWHAAEGTTTRIGSPKLGELHKAYLNCRSGDHTSEGLFLAQGPGIRSGMLGRTVSIMDFAPTIADLLGVDFACDDGTPILELLGTTGQLAATV